MKTKVLFVTKALGNGGSEKHLVELVSRLDPSRIKAGILCYGRDPYTRSLDQCRNLEFEIYNLRQPRTIFVFWTHFVKLKPDVIVFVNGQPGIFPPAAYAAARMSGANRVVGIEHLILVSNGSGKFHHWLELYGTHILLRRRMPGLLSHATICVSNAVRKELLRKCKYPVKKTQTIWNGVDLNHFQILGTDFAGIRQQLKINRDDKVVICVSRLGRWKNIELLLIAMRSVLKNLSSCKCIIVGDGELRAQLESTAEQIGISSSVFFVGHQEDIRAYLAAGDIFVLPSSREGLPLALLEAMASGLCCIATDVAGNAEAVKHGDTGLIVPPKSAADLAAAIEYLVTHEADRIRMGVNGRKRAEQYFNIEETMENIKSVLFPNSIAMD